MKNPADLFQLIRSLTPSEKGYYKKYVAKGNGKKYLKLFDAINGMEKYDEEKLKKKFRKELSNFSASKNYLYESILETLRSNSKNAVEYGNVHRWLEYGSWLYDRKLFSQMPGVLRKGLELAKQTIPEYQLIYEAQLRNAYLISGDYEKLEEFIHTGYDAQLENIETVRLQLMTNLLSILTVKLHEFPTGINLNNNVHETLKQAQQLIKDLSYPTGIKLIDRKITSALINYYKYLNDPVRAFIYARHNYEDEYTEPGSPPINAFLAYNNYMVMCRNLCLDEELKAVPLKAKSSLVAGLPESCRSIYARNEYLNALYFQITRPATSDDALVEKIEQWLRTSQYLSKGHKNSLHLQYVHLYFMRARFSKALFYLSEIQNETRGQEPVYYKTALLIQLLVYFDTEDWENLRRLLSKTTTEITTHKLTTGETVLLGFFTACVKNNSSISLKRRLTELNAKLEILTNNPSERSILSLFPFFEWLQSKITGSSMVETILETRKKKGQENLEKIKETKKEIPPLSVSKNNLSKQNLN